MRQTPPNRGESKERILKSTLVILTSKRPKSNKKSASASQKVKKPKPRVDPTPAEVEAREQNGREYEQRPEHKELKRRITQDRRDKAKSLGLCVACRATPIPDQTRCETCAEQHRQYRRQARERAKQQREQESGQTSIF